MSRIGLVGRWSLLRPTSPLGPASPLGPTSPLGLASPVGRASFVGLILWVLLAAWPSDASAYPDTAVTGGPLLAKNRGGSSQEVSRSAQDDPREDPREDPRSTRPSRTVHGMSLRNALRSSSALLKDGHHQEVIDLLEPVLESYPGEERVIRVLAEAYAGAGRHDDAIGLYREEIDRSGGRNAQMWSMLIMTQREAGRCSEAVGTILEILEREPGWLSRFSDQLEMAVTDTTCGPAALIYLEEQVQSAADPPSAWREALGHVYVVRRDYDQAMGVYTAIERGQRLGGQYIYNLARVLSRRGEYEAAVAAYDSVLAVATTRQLREPAMFERAVLLEKLGRIEEAAAYYGELAETYPHTALGMRADLARAGLYMGPLGDLGRARQAFRAVLEFIENRPKNAGLLAIQEEARLALAECALRTGHFEEADSAYVQIEREATKTKTKEQAAFAHAQLLYFQGRFPEAEEAFFRISDDYEGGEWVNDAFAQALLIGEFAGRAPGALETLASAEFERLRGNLASADSLCREALADTTQVLLRDHLRALQIELRGERREWAAADSLLQDLLADEPSPRVGADVLLWMGLQAESDPRRWEQAISYYEDVIIRFPGSFETRRARDRLRAMSREVERS